MNRTRLHAHSARVASKKRFVKFTHVDFSLDSRDQREAATAAAAGYDVVVCTPPLSRPLGTNHEIHERNEVQTRSRSAMRVVQMARLLWSDPRHIASHRATLLSCHDIWALLSGWLSLMWTPRGQRPGLIYDAHEFELGRAAKRGALKKHLIRHMERFLARRADVVWAVNDSIADAMLGVHHLQKRPIVVRSIPDVGQFRASDQADRRRQIRERHGIPWDSPVISYHGFICPGRGIENGLDILAAAPFAHYIIVGDSDGSTPDEIKRLSQEMELADRVHFLARVDQSELPYILGAADVGLVLIEPISRSYELSLPNKLFECIHARLPVLGSDLPEIARVIHTYGSGETVAPLDRERIVAAALSLLERVRKGDPSLRTACEAAAQNFTWTAEQAVMLRGFTVAHPGA